MKVYVAGKVSKDSVFGTHHWRDEFIKTLESFSGKTLQNIDPTRAGIDQNNYEAVFAADAYMISICDVFIVYLSDDISVGGSQEILLAKYFKKPVIGLAPEGGRFNASTQEFYGQKIASYKYPFVFATCDIVCGNIEEAAEALVDIENISPKELDIIGNAAATFRKEYLSASTYLQKFAN